MAGQNINFHKNSPPSLRNFYFIAKIRHSLSKQNFKTVNNFERTNELHVSLNSFDRKNNEIKNFRKLILNFSMEERARYSRTSSRPTWQTRAYVLDRPLPSFTPLAPSNVYRVLPFSPSPSSPGQRSKHTRQSNISLNVRPSSTRSILQKGPFSTPMDPTRQ